MKNGSHLASFPDMTRYYLFGTTIILGFAAVLYLGWGRAPGSSINADPSLLREDFRADYTLMVAEALAADHDLDRAEESLAFLDTDNVLAAVESAIEFGAEAGFSEMDISLLDDLADALATLSAQASPSEAP